MKTLKPLFKHDFGERPICSIVGCVNPRQWMGQYNKKDGKPRYRKICGAHHSQTFGYSKYRKMYCENKDSRLGYKCNSKIRLSRQLEVDHIDGNPYNNDPTNLQTLCVMCHIFKTFSRGDNKTAGRKTLKQDYYRNYKEAA
jgi:hypothetical protein